MKNTIGQSIYLTIFGESHGPYIGITLDGLPAGFSIDQEKIQAAMNRRKAIGQLSTQRHEDDIPEIISGYFEGKTTGQALTILIKNSNTRSQDYAQFKSRLRPGHADFTAYEKYHGFQDYRGGGHFSGRLTAALVAAGSICAQILEAKNILIGSHIEQLYTIKDKKFSQDQNELCQQIKDMNKEAMSVLTSEIKQSMQEEILKAKENLDSLGGIIESAILNVPAGLGEPFFDSLESTLSHLLFSVPAVKGVSFGEGFGFARLTGFQANDAFIVRNGSIETETNHNAGINGGISNGMPIIINTCIKPTPSIYKQQHSVNYLTKEEVDLEIKGRHDPCILSRACVVIDSVLSFGLLDAMITGGHYAR